MLFAVVDRMYYYLNYSIKYCLSAAVSRIKSAQIMLFAVADVARMLKLQYLTLLQL